MGCSRAMLYFLLIIGECMMGWTCGCYIEDKVCVQGFGGETCWKIIPLVKSRRGEVGGTD